MDNILELISSKLNNCSKGHEKIAKYILTHYDEVVFMTASKLGKFSNTSESTVVRFSTSLGFEGFSELQLALKNHVKSDISRKKDISYSTKVTNIPDAVKVIFEKDIDNIKNSIEEFDYDAFEHAVKNIAEAKNIYIIGLRNAEAPARILYTELNLIRKNVNLVLSSITSEIYEQLLHIGSDDLLISFGFPEYPIRTIKAMEFANVKRANIISITDNKYSPMTMYSSCVLIAKSNMTDEIASLTACMSLVNALTIAVMRQCRNNYEENIAGLNEAIDNLN